MGRKKRYQSTSSLNILESNSLFYCLAPRHFWQMLVQAEKNLLLTTSGWSLRGIETWSRDEVCTLWEHLPSQCDRTLGNWQTSYEQLYCFQLFMLLAWNKAWLFIFKVHSDREQWKLWTARDYTQSQHKNTIRCDLTSGMQISQYERRQSCSVASIASIASLLKVESIELFIRWCCVAKANQCCDSSNINDIRMAPTLPEFAGRTLNRTLQLKQLSLCEYHEAPTTQLYTPQDYLMNKDTMLLSFPTFLGLP